MLKASWIVGLKIKGTPQEPAQTQLRQTSLTTGLAPSASQYRDDPCCMFCLGTSEEELLVLATARCNHNPDSCRDCLVRYLESKVEDKSLVSARKTQLWSVSCFT